MTHRSLGSVTQKILYHRHVTYIFQLTEHEKHIQILRMRNFSEQTVTELLRIEVSVCKRTGSRYICIQNQYQYLLPRVPNEHRHCILSKSATN